MKYTEEEKENILASLDKEYFSTNDAVKRKKIKATMDKIKQESAYLIISQQELARRFGCSRDKLLRDIRTRENLYNELVAIGYRPKGRHGFYPKEVEIIEKYLVK